MPGLPPHAAASIAQGALSQNEGEQGQAWGGGVDGRGAGEIKVQPLSRKVSRALQCGWEGSVGGVGWGYPTAGLMSALGQQSTVVNM